MAASDVSIRRVMVNPPGLDVDHEAVVLHNGEQRTSSSPDGGCRTP